MSTCADLEAIAGELARGDLCDAAARKQALLHVRECARCARRLEDERALSAGLLALAATSEDEQAPPRVEEALRAALRQEMERTARPAPRHRSDTRIRALRWMLAGSGAAAAALLAWALIAARPPEVMAPAPPSQAIRTPQPAVSAATDLPTLPARSEPRVITARPTRRPVVMADAGELDRQAETADPEEDFVSLRAGDRLADLDSLQVVQVEIPRSALVSLGWPLDVELDARRVRADVILGEDGVARAIRLVQTSR